MAEIKGSIVLEATKALKERLGEPGYEGVLARLDPGTRALFLNRIPTLQTLDWFPLDAFVRFLQADLEVSDGGREAALVARSESSIDRQLRGIYKAFASLGSPEEVIARVSAIHATYFRGVQVERKHSEKGEALVRYTGFEAQHRLMEFAIMGFYRKALHVCGASDVQARFATGIADSKGYAELALTWA